MKVQVLPEPLSAPVYVSRPVLPERDAFTAALAPLWDSHILTNLGPMHEQLERAVAERIGGGHVSLWNNAQQQLEQIIKLRWTLLEDAQGTIPVPLLILLGALFLLQNTGLWYLSMDALWPAILIALGVWLFAKRKSAAERGDFRHRSLAGPAVLVTLGVIFLLDNLHNHWWNVPGFGRTWPLILLVIGVLKLVERGYLGGNHPPAVPPISGGPYEQQPPTEVNSEVKNG